LVGKAPQKSNIGSDEHIGLFAFLLVEQEIDWPSLNISNFVLNKASLYN